MSSQSGSQQQRRQRDRTPTVLITNDDGPPGPESPFIYEFVQTLKRDLGWGDVRVVIPDSQKSWIGKAYEIKKTTVGHYYYPKSPDGRRGETSDHPLYGPDGKGKKEGDADEWVLLSGTPATCTNIALHNIYPSSTDLVISGPNYGRNTSSAFALSSGTIGASLSSSLSSVPSIAISYALFEKPPMEEVVRKANEIAVEIVGRLWEKGFPEHEGGRLGEGVGLYTVNVPLVPSILEPPTRAAWTTMSTNRYSRLFKQKPPSPADETTEAGPGALSPSSASATATGDPSKGTVYAGERGERGQGDSSKPLTFVFSPEFGPLLFPKNLVPGTDVHALHSGWVSITPLKPAFEAAEPPFGFEEVGGEVEEVEAAGLKVDGGGKGETEVDGGGDGGAGRVRLWKL